MVSGAVVATGYWRHSELTESRFSCSPEGARCFAMGDLGRRLPDGRFEVLGRTDQQVKIAGARVDLVEVERALRDSIGGTIYSGTSEIQRRIIARSLGLGS